jgi:hypothetical protein
MIALVVIEIRPAHISPLVWRCMAAEKCGMRFGSVATSKRSPSTITSNKRRVSAACTGGAGSSTCGGAGGVTTSNTDHAEPAAMTANSTRTERARSNAAVLA